MSDESENITIDRLYREYWRGVEDERGFHKLTEWDSVPDVDGWYWFKARYINTDPYHIGEKEYRYKIDEPMDGICRIGNGFYGEGIYCGPDYFEPSHMHECTFHGPIPNPFGVEDDSE